MILDYSNCNLNDRLSNEAQFVGGSCTLDGKKVDFVWYVDTEAGVVKTYDVYSHPQARLTITPHPTAVASLDELKVFERLPKDVTAEPGGVMMWTRKGKVELFRQGEIEHV
jgi:hypothetical protein